MQHIVSPAGSIKSSSCAGRRAHRETEPDDDVEDEVVDEVPARLANCPWQSVCSYGLYSYGRGLPRKLPVAVRM